MSQPGPTPNDRPAVWPLVIEDMRARDRIGTARYGTPLQPFNGRDPLQDAYEEALDLAVYLKQAIIERDHAKSVTEGLAERVAKQSELLSKRAEKPA